MNPNLSTLLKASDVVSSIFTKVSDNAPVLLALFFTCAVISFTPTENFPDYAKSPKAFLPFVTIFLGVYFLSLYYYSYRRFLHARKNLHSLGTDEKSLLKIYLKKDVSCMMLSPIMNGVAATLASKGILTIAASTFSAIEAPFAIQPFFQTYLRKHPELVGLKKEEIGSDADTDDETDLDLRNY